MRSVRQVLVQAGVVALAISALIALPTSSRAEDPRHTLCLMLESAAKANDLPLAFLARVIWRESHFDPNAVGPVTRSGDRAQGIAQFMPGTAVERGLLDPFNPVEALTQAAAFLSQLRGEFGNLGLAAAAYNAGPARIQGWLAGTRSMPAETRAYVEAITGRSVEDWAKAGAVDMVVPNSDCRTIVVSLQREPSGFLYELEKRVETALAKPWGVELAAGFSRDRVLDIYGRLMKRLADLIGTHDPIVTRMLLRSRGTHPLYQARIGADTRAAADRLCNQIRGAGAACLVTRVHEQRATVGKGASATKEAQPAPAP
jgi:membrane-bound lytic murein transglycosylase MltF